VGEQRQKVLANAVPLRSVAKAVALLASGGARDVAATELIVDCGFTQV
jgi:hypothetical protein